MNTVETYLPNAVYDHAVEALRTLRPDPLTGAIERHQIVEILGEIGNIWPASVLDDPERGFVLGRANLVKKTA